MNRELLEIEVRKARKVFDEHAREISETLFSTFPRGCCGNASLLLANWLVEQGFRGPKVILASGESGASHSWIVLDDLIIDITADQFEDQCHGLYPIDSEYHASFVEQAEDSLHIDGVLADPLNKFFQFMENA